MKITYGGIVKTVLLVIETVKFLLAISDRVKANKKK